MEPRIIFHRVLPKIGPIIDANQLMCVRAQAFCARKHPFGVVQTQGLGCRCGEKATAAERPRMMNRLRAASDDGWECSKSPQKRPDKKFVQTMHSGVKNGRFEPFWSCDDRRWKSRKSRKWHTWGGFVQLFSPFLTLFLRFWVRFARFYARQIFKSQRQIFKRRWLLKTKRHQILLDSV